MGAEALGGQDVFRGDANIVGWVDGDAHTCRDTLKTTKFCALNGRTVRYVNDTSRGLFRRARSRGECGEAQSPRTATRSWSGSGKLPRVAPARRDRPRRALRKSRLSWPRAPGSARQPPRAAVCARLRKFPPCRPGRLRPQTTSRPCVSRVCGGDFFINQPCAQHSGRAPGGRCSRRELGCPPHDR